MPSQQISRMLKLEATVQALVGEVNVLRDVSRRQHEYIRELYELKSTTASKAELHAAVASLRGARGGGGGSVDYGSTGENEDLQADMKVLEGSFRKFMIQTNVDAKKVVI